MNEEATKVAADAILVDREALVALYNLTNGDNWTRNKNWLSDAALGEWYGVETNAEGRVIGLNLWKNQLSGPIPRELGNLSELTELILGVNQLTGTIPSEIANLTELESIDLGYNDFTGCISRGLRSRLFLIAKSGATQGLVGQLGENACDDELAFSLDEGPQIYNDNVFVLPISKEILTVQSLPIEAYARLFY